MKRKTKDYSMQFEWSEARSEIDGLEFECGVGKCYALELNLRNNDSNLIIGNEFEYGVGRCWDLELNLG